MFDPIFEAREQLVKLKNTNDPPTAAADDGFFPISHWKFSTANTVVVTFNENVSIDTYTFWTRTLAVMVPIEIVEAELPPHREFLQVVKSKEKPNSEIPSGWRLDGANWKPLVYSQEHWHRKLIKRHPREL